MPPKSSGGWRERFRSLLRWRPLPIVTLYVLGAGLWIVTTDWLVSQFARSMTFLLVLSTVKGELFVAGTAVLLFFHLCREHQEQEARETALRQQTITLEAIRAVTAEITRELDIAALLQLITQRSMELVGAQSGSVYLWDDHAHVLVPQTWPGLGDWYREVRPGLGEGVAGTIAQRREGLVVTDYRRSSYATPFFLERTTISAVMGEPLLYGDRLSGVILVRHHGPSPTFTERERHLLRLFAAQAAIAIETARLFAAADRSAREARSLYEVAHRLTTSMDASEVLQFIAVKTTELLSTPNALVVLWDEAARTLRLGAAHGTQVERVKDQEFRLGVGVTGIVAETHAPLIVNDYQAWPHRVPELREPVAVIGVPLLYHDHLLGVLTTLATSPGTHFADHHLALLTSFANQAATAIENARLYEGLWLAAVQLEARVEERTHELAEVNRRLEAASRHKSEFLANMSHELRTPLNSILGFSQLLLEQTTESLSSKQRRYLSNVHNSGEHLLQLINDILDLSKVEAGKLTLNAESLSISKVLDETLVIIRGLAGKKELQLQVSIQTDMPRLVADPVRLKQILFNLVSNAVKFTPEWGQITVSAHRTADPAGALAVTPEPDGRDGWLEVRVADTGIGIKAEDMPRLFNEFVQLDATATKHYEGTGLGLALTKRLVELHGGRIWAESEGLGRGACFVVHLPFVEAPTPRILVVDDEASLLRVLCMILRGEGYAVDAARDASEAIAAVDASPPALVVLDVGLPPDGAGGWTVLAHLRAPGRPLAVPVLILTGQDQVGAEEALRRGANEFLGKPISAQVLLDAVRRLLRPGTPAAAHADVPAGTDR